MDLIFSFSFRSDLKLFFKYPCLQNTKCYLDISSAHVHLCIPVRNYRRTINTSFMENSILGKEEATESLPSCECLPLELLRSFDETDGGDSRWADERLLLSSSRSSLTALIFCLHHVNVCLYTHRTEHK